ncbi:MAG: LptF/LptG family permease [Fimbriimonas sp.]
MALIPSRRTLLKRIDALVLREIVGPWGFGVAMFSALLMAATYLPRIASYMVDGLPGGVILRFSLLLLPAILVQTFAMSMLLAGLLSFGKMSSDSEIVALRAAGASIPRILRPVCAFSIFVAVVAFTMNETIVPGAARATLELQNQIARTLDSKTLRASGYPIMENGVMTGGVWARDFDLQARALKDATVIAYTKEGRPSAFLYARVLEFDPDLFAQGGGWRILGGATVVAADGSSVIQLENEAWPDAVPRPKFSLDDLLTNQVRDLTVFSMAQMKDQIEKEKANPKANPAQVRNLEYQYWNKLALPLAAFVFGALGATLGIRNHRTGTAAGFALAVAIIFGYFTIANFMNQWAMGGLIAPYVASFTPVVLGLGAAVVLMIRRNG